VSVLAEIQISVKRRLDPFTGHFPPAKGAFSSRLFSPGHMDFTSLLEELPPNGRDQLPGNSGAVFQAAALNG